MVLLLLLICFMFCKRLEEHLFPSAAYVAACDR